jgi:hypothetical protein
MRMQAPQLPLLGAMLRLLAGAPQQGRHAEAAHVTERLEPRQRRRFRRFDCGSRGAPNEHIGRAQRYQLDELREMMVTLAGGAPVR